MISPLSPFNVAVIEVYSLNVLYKNGLQNKRCIKASDGLYHTLESESLSSIFFWEEELVADLYGPIMERTFRFTEFAHNVQSFISEQLTHREVKTLFIMGSRPVVQNAFQAVAVDKVSFNALYYSYHSTRDGSQYMVTPVPGDRPILQKVSVKPFHSMLVKEPRSF